MKKISILNILNNKSLFINKKVIIKGWLRSKRTSKSGYSFLDIYDSSCIYTLQIIAKKKLPNYQTEILKLTTGCSLKIKGIILLSKGKKQDVELIAKEIFVIGIIYNSDTYPITAKKHTKTYLRNYLHLRARTGMFRTIFRLRHYLYYIINNFFHLNNFYWVSTPIITNLNCEGAGEIFNIYSKYLDKPFFLTVSGQLHLEAFACSLSKVYTLGPIFRADNSNTTKHLSEFWMLEVEIAFIKLKGLIEFTKKFIKYILHNILSNYNEELLFLEALTYKNNLIKRLNNFIYNEYIEIDYNEIIKILITKHKNFLYPIKWGIDLQSEHEKYLTNEYFNNIVIVKNFPKKIKPFYMKMNNDNKTVASFDILFPDIGEIIGGSQREDNLYKLEQQINKIKLNKLYYNWYLDLRKYGTVYHSGFGLGFDRLLCFITGIENIKDVVPFYRSIKQINY